MALISNLEELTRPRLEDNVFQEAGRNFVRYMNGPIGVATAILAFTPLWGISVFLALGILAESFQQTTNKSALAKKNDLGSNSPVV